MSKKQKQQPQITVSITDATSALTNVANLVQRLPGTPKLTILRMNCLDAIDVHAKSKDTKSNIKSMSNYINVIKFAVDNDVKRLQRPAEHAAYAEMKSIMRGLFADRAEIVDEFPVDESPVDESTHAYTDPIDETEPDVIADTVPESEEAVETAPIQAKNTAKKNTAKKKTAKKKK